MTHRQDSYDGIVEQAQSVCSKRSVWTGNVPVQVATGKATGKATGNASRLPDAQVGWASSRSQGDQTCAGDIRGTSIQWPTRRLLRLLVATRFISELSKIACSWLPGLADNMLCNTESVYRKLAAQVSETGLSDHSEAFRSFRKRLS